MQGLWLLMRPDGSATSRVLLSSPFCGEEISSWPMTRRPCRRVCRAYICQAVVRLRYGSLAVARCRLTMFLFFPASYSGRGAFAPPVRRVLDPPRLVSLDFEGASDTIWAGIAGHGRPIQYAHVPAPLALWDVWAPIAGPPVAFEPPPP